MSGSAKLTGGDRLARKLAELTDRLSDARTLRVGFLEGARYPDGTPVAMVAAIQDYGAPKVGIPPRPFFRNMVAAKKAEWPRTIARLLKDNDYDARKTLLLVGEGIKGQLQQSIRDTNLPPLKPATVRGKGFEKPLINTGHMINSVDYEVK